MRIVIVNAHWNNRGDEAALFALLRFLHETYSKIKIGIIFKECKKKPVGEWDCVVEVINTSYRLEEDLFCKILNDGEDNGLLPIKEEMDLISGSDAVIYAPGGAVISDRFFWSKQLEYLFPIAYAEKNSIPVFFANPSLGPFTEEHLIRNNILNDVTYISVRESISKNNLQISSACGSDLAFLYDIQKDVNIFSKEELSSFFSKYPKVVGITITDLKWNVGYLSKNSIYQRIHDVFKEFINDLITCFGCGVLLIPQLFNEQNDANYLKEYIREGVFLLSDKYNSEMQQKVISKCFAVVGLRYHSCIFAINNEIPVIPISYEQKMDGLCLDNEIENWRIPVEKLDRNELKNCFERLEKEYEERKKKLKKIKSRCREKAWKSMIPIRTYIQSKLS